MNYYLKYILYIATHLVLSQHIIATTRKIEMPDAYELLERLHTIGIEHNVVKIYIACCLGEQYKMPVEVITCVDRALDLYSEYLEQKVPIAWWATLQQLYVYSNRSLIVETLLQDDGEALMEAQKIMFN